VAAHGGTTGVDTVPGEGARFWITLPLAAEAA
jgi:signal transduction histidine kinase